MRLEHLERRDLLTSVIAPDIIYWPQDQFVVRRDEAKPVELHLGNWQGDIVVPLNVDPTSTDPATDVTSPPPVTIIDSGSGTATVSRDASSILYQPAPGFIGIDIVTLRYDDASAEKSVTEDTPALERRIAINVVEPLLAVDDWFQVDVNAQRVPLDVLVNDLRNAPYIGTAPVFSLQEAVILGEGAVTISDDLKQLTYTPPKDFEGVQTIQYVAIDGDGYTAEGSVQIRVSPERRETLWPEQLHQQMVQLAVNQNQYRMGGPNYPYPMIQPRILMDGTVSPTVESVDVSGTNNQIAEVDESDRIKTDGRYLYVLSSPDQPDWMGWDIFPWIGLRRPIPEDPGSLDGNLLTIIDVRQPDEPIIISRQLFQDRVLSLDLDGSRLTVISQRDDQTVVTVVDVTDPAAPKNVWTTVVDGRFNQARRVDGTLYVFTTEYGITVPPLDIVCSQGDEFCFYETGRQYLRGLTDDALIEAIFPSQQVFDADGNPVGDVPSLMIDPLIVGVPEHYSRSNLITFDTSSSVGGAVDWEVTSSFEHLLVTPSSIYITRTNYQSELVFVGDPVIFADIPARPTVMTEIERFKLLGDGLIEPASHGAVPGTLNNSFSLDEYDGLLRIATENSWWNAAIEGSNVYVVEQVGPVMKVVGGVQGLAPGEQIYAVRFAQDRGYVVTFRRVDPLFIIDLSVPTQPEVLGQLKAPGYSQYLHIIDRDHLLGIGRDADEATGAYGGLVVSLFNVSDPNRPFVQDRYEFEGGRSTFSPFAEDNPWDLRDHHAISYFAQSAVLALPIYSRQWVALEGEDAPIFASAEESAVRTLQIDIGAGITEIDSIPFDSRADRTLRIGPYLYSLSSSELKVTRLLEPGNVLASLVFQSSGQDDFFDAPFGEAVTIDVTRNDSFATDELTLLDVELIEGDGDLEIIDGNQIRFTPTDQKLLERRIHYMARTASGTLIDAVATIDPDLRWHNDRSAYDVNDDQKTTSLDALNIINLLAVYGAVDSEEIERSIGEVNDNTWQFYFDTSNDHRLSGLDALLVINELERKESEIEGSGTNQAALSSVLRAAGTVTPEPEFVADADEFPAQNEIPVQDAESEIATFDDPVGGNHEAIDIVLCQEYNEQTEGEALEEDLLVTGLAGGI